MPLSVITMKPDMICKLPGTGPIKLVDFPAPVENSKRGGEFDALQLRIHKVYLCQHILVLWTLQSPHNGSASEGEAISTARSPKVEQHTCLACPRKKGNISLQCAHQLLPYSMTT